MVLLAMRYKSANVDAARLSFRFLHQVPGGLAIRGSVFLTVERILMGIKQQTYWMTGPRRGVEEGVQHRSTRQVEHLGADPILFMNPFSTSR